MSNSELLTEWKNVKWRASTQDREESFWFCFYNNMFTFSQWTKSTNIQERTWQWIDEDVLQRLAGSEYLHLQYSTVHGDEMLYNVFFVRDSMWHTASNYLLI